MAGSEGSWGNLKLPQIPEVELHSMIGISLSLGFIFMLLVDQLFGGGHSHGGSGIGILWSFLPECCFLYTDVFTIYDICSIPKSTFVLNLTKVFEIYTVYLYVV